jgi:hypothetical protein
MCQNCSAASGIYSEIDFLKKYLRMQEQQLLNDPGDEVVRDQINKTRELLIELERMTANPCLQM